MLLGKKAQVVVYSRGFYLPIPTTGGVERIALGKRNIRVRQVASSISCQPHEGSDWRADHRFENSLLGVFLTAQGSVSNLL